MREFAKHKILVFFCDDSHLPSGIYSPFLAHYRSSAMLDSQIAFTRQNKSILWQKIVQSKIHNQANLLAYEGRISVSSKLYTLQKGVKLADSTNNEAKASALYFPALFGQGFSRKDFSPLNSALNYGYAIIRGCIARNLVGSGLLPSLGIFHANQFNPFNLADDVIEPYRPFVDSKVVSLGIENELELCHRVELVNILNTKVLLGGKVYPLHRSITRIVWNLANFIRGKTKKIQFPIFNKDSNGREIYESTCDV